MVLNDEDLSCRTRFLYVLMFCHKFASAIIELIQIFDTFFKSFVEKRNAC